MAAWQGADVHSRIKAVGIGLDGVAAVPGSQATTRSSPRQRTLEGAFPGLSRRQHAGGLEGASPR